MRMVGIVLLVVSYASAGCTEGTTEPSVPRGLTAADVGIPKERAAKALKVLESANDHNDRLQRTERQLFAEHAK
jgi:hypothetical protein